MTPKQLCEIDLRKQARQSWWNLAFGLVVSASAAGGVWYVWRYVPHGMKQPEILYWTSIALGTLAGLCLLILVTSRGEVYRVVFDEEGVVFKYLVRGQSCYPWEKLRIGFEPDPLQRVWVKQGNVGCSLYQHPVRRIVIHVKQSGSYHFPTQGCEKVLREYLAARQPLVELRFEDTSITGWSPASSSNLSAQFGQADADDRLRELLGEEAYAGYRRELAADARKGVHEKNVL